MQAVHTKTQEEYNELLDILDKKGGKWCNGNIINRDGIFKHWYQEKTCVNIDDITSLYVWLDDYKKMNDIPVCEFKRWEIVEIRDNLRHEWSRKIDTAKKRLVMMTDEEYNLFIKK